MNLLQKVKDNPGICTDEELALALAFVEDLSEKYKAFDSAFCSSLAWKTAPPDFERVMKNIENVQKLRFYFRQSGISPYFKLDAHQVKQTLEMFKNGNIVPLFTKQKEGYWTQTWDGQWQFNPIV